MKKKIMLMLTMVFLGGQVLFANGGYERAVQSFINAETAEARNMLSGFSESFLESFAEEYKSSLKVSEARKLWLVEELYKRKADKTAADRLFYVFLAVTLLMVLIFALTWRIYQMQKKLENLE